MKQTITLLAVALLFMAGCNNSTKTADEGKTTAPAFTPYKSRLVVLTVNDFDTWYTAFKAHDSLPKAYGLTNPGVGRELDSANKVIVMSNVADLQKAMTYDTLPMRKANMAKGGVTNSSTPSYWNVIMDDTSKIPQHERCMVMHHVKDYATWKKVFDKEGMDSRKANGFYERGIARSVVDSNMVGLLFAITDMQKMKARLASPELKKIMQDGGVDGTPQVMFFKWVND